MRKKESSIMTKEPQKETVKHDPQAEEPSAESSGNHCQEEVAGTSLILHKTRRINLTIEKC